MLEKLKFLSGSNDTANLFLRFFFSKIEDKNEKFYTYWQYKINAVKIKKALYPRIGRTHKPYKGGIQGPWKSKILYSNFSQKMKKE